MPIEEELFLTYICDEDKLIPYGFNFENDQYIFKTKIPHYDFTAFIFYKDKKISGKIIDDNFDDEYNLFRNEKIVGEFIGGLKESYKNILLDIRDKCFIKVLFPDPQSNRIADFIYEKYGDEVEFPWPKYPYFGVFRNQNNNKWYGLITNVEDDKLGKDISGRSLINLKVNQIDHDELIKLDNIFPAWHMNKKLWISLSLSNYFSDEFVMSIIDKSYIEIEKLNKNKNK